VFDKVGLRGERGGGGVDGGGVKKREGGGGGRACSSIIKYLFPKIGIFRWVTC